MEDDKHPCIEKAEELDIEIEDGMIILKRDIAANGKKCMSCKWKTSYP